MMCGRLALLLVLVAMPATFASIDHYRRYQGFQAPHEDEPGQNPCLGFSDQVQSLQDTLDANGGKIESVAQDTELVLLNQEGLSDIGETLENGQDVIRDIALEIRGKQGNDLQTVLGALGDVEANLEGQLSQLEGDFVKIHAGQKTLQSTLEQTSVDLSEDNDQLFAGLGTASAERVNLLTLLQAVFDNTEELKANVRANGARLEALESCVESLCAAPKIHRRY